MAGARRTVSAWRDYREIWRFIAADLFLHNRDPRTADSPVLT